MRRFGLALNFQRLDAAVEPAQSILRCFDIASCYFALTAAPDERLSSDPRLLRNIFARSAALDI